MTWTQYKVIELGAFRRFADKLTVDERLAIVTHLSINPLDGDLIPGGGGARKLRWATSEGKGKSGGARVIHFFVSTAGTVYLLAMYEKSRMENLSKGDINKIAVACKALKGGL